ncbi:MAG: ABC transporter ATP-binding protein [Acidiferrobacter sp.]
MNDTVVTLEHIDTVFGTQVIHEDISLTVHHTDIVGLVGGSGSGKTTLVREMIGLTRPTAGRVTLLGCPLDTADDATVAALRSRCGVLFQGGALFSALSVFDNIAFPLRELRVVEKGLIRELVYMKLNMVGLDNDVGGRLPAELSGGMVKRVALARALALEPELLFLDEPTSGLDAVTAEAFVKHIDDLRQELSFTAVVITHDLDLMHDLCTHLAILADHRLVAFGPPGDVIRSSHPFVQALFTGTRGQRVFGSVTHS